MYSLRFLTRFWAHVNRRDDPARCWLWTGARSTDGYGQIFWFHSGSRPRRRSVNKRVHRVTYELAYGAIPAGLFVCHGCDQPLCVNPSHLFLGTPAENTRDAVNKHRQKIPEATNSFRHRRPQGEQNVHAKLTASFVQEIRRIYAQGTRSQQSLADEFHVHQNQISRIIRRSAWRHL